MARSQEECIAYLEQIRWNGVPQCPYCGSTHSSKIEQGLRHHCNECFTSYSVTVGTIFHKTHIPLEKWFAAIPLILNADKPISVRKLAKQIRVSKNSAAHMIEQVRQVDQGNQLLIEAIQNTQLLPDT